MDKRYFETDGIRGKVGQDPITPEFALKLGWAIGEILRQNTKSPPTVLVGKDTRVSKDMLEYALVSGLVTSGVNVQCLGILPTPALSYLITHRKADAGIMITASHNAYTDNGFKCFEKTGIKFSSALQTAIAQKLHQAINITNPQTLGTVQQIENAQQDYLKFCQKTVPDYFSLNGKKIVLDCAHGATYKMAPQLFESLGAEVILIGSEPNGLNINLECGSTYPETLQKRVLQEKAAVGIAFDGDGDRIIMVDHTGCLCDGDDLLFILAKAELEKNSRTSVVGTLMSNHGLALSLDKLGIHFIRAPVGDQYVYDTLVRENLALGGEPSGHIMCRDFSPTADGLIAALQVLFALERTTLHEARASLHKLPQRIINVPANNAQSIIECETLKTAIQEAETKLIDFKGRLLVRASGTEPLVRIMVEGTESRVIQEIAEKLSKVVLAAEARLFI